MSRRTSLPLAVAGCLLVASSVVAIDVSGTLPAGTVWNSADSPYRVTDTLWVSVGDTLRIEPGVDVLFDADVQFIVQGAMHAVGTETDSIRFIKGNAAEWGGIRISGGDSSTIHFARISDGHADDSNHPDGDGGGIYIVDTGSRLNLSHTKISGNKAAVAGGGIYVWYASVTMDRCEISNNIGTFDGGGVYLVSPGASALITNCTLVGNSAIPASGGIAGGIFLSQSVDITIVNTILWGNSPNEIYDQNQSANTISVRYSNVMGGYGALADSNLSLSPMFVDSANGDFHLQSGSPLIDKGDPLGPNDPDGTRADVGAYYFNQKARHLPHSSWSCLHSP